MGRVEEDAVRLDDIQKAFANFEIMEALKVIQSTTDGVLRIEVPDHFRNTELEVIVIPVVADRPARTADKKGIEQYFGTAKYPQTKTNKWDAYNQ